MATEWSDDIVVCDLADEPQLSEELGDLYQQLQKRQGDEMPNVVLDLSAISYLNSSNIAQMLRLRKILVESNRKIKLSGVADAVWSIMLLTGLDKVFEFAPDKSTAIAAFQIENS
ncbi:MAG: anti-sigma factor antagonist [Phycisphaeraceae bacterium]|nr:MAG: anti-sigma factor antagonist [Phycisphaeraceae bacterium]